MSKSNMYPWITGTWNPLAGECPHKCIYCSTKSFHWPSLKAKYSGELRLDEKAMNKNLGKGKTWFVCAQNDLFAAEVPQEFINRIVMKCLNGEHNTYVFQTKNPERYLTMDALFPENAILGCTIESNQSLTGISCAPETYKRMLAMEQLQCRKFITIEPIMDFDVDNLSLWIKRINPEFVNIGADSKRHNLPEPPVDKIHALIEKLNAYGIEIREKHNLERLIK